MSGDAVFQVIAELVAVLSLVVVYGWAIYNVPILVAGIRNRRQTSGQSKASVAEGALPMVSVVVPAKNEAVVLPRILHALVQQEYPPEKMEIIVAEDGSKDASVEVCLEVAEQCRRPIRVIHGAESNGKPAALNRALQVSRGEIIAIFDADNVPEPDALRKAATYFQDAQVAAIQGRTLSLNSDVNMLTKLLSFEDVVVCEGWIKGRDALGLFVHMKGSCEFVRKEVLEALGGWKDGCLSEDLEMSAKITAQGHKIRYASDVHSWQEAPETLTTILHQRTRWFLGVLEVAFSFGRLLRKPSPKTFDAETVFFSPFVLIASLLGYFVGPFLLTSTPWAASLAITFAGWLLLMLGVLVTGVVLMQAAKPKKARDLLWIPFIHGYWFLQSFLAIWALIKTTLGIPGEWKKTPKTGTIDSADFSAQSRVKTEIRQKKE